ncbi:autotransporter outer membrane beta-barrel domain-containing protein [Sphingomonas sp. Leaf62]|uniref:autotransporter outer membrane beta-barrel domain-containing protein n=1 Tax=Sphingomonas sp. Leaf62 TaxID=1736228 RepID=UPI000B2B3636|nr:autotransporter outer membrane beta-barrel domain-containing protein [Sphingomonas sp. Leaf62]
MAASSAANAQCSPDPVTSSTPTNCTGTDNDGLTVDAFNSRVIVAEGATVRGGTDAAITTRAQLAAFTINGRVDGDSRIGFLVTTSEPYLAPCDPYAGASVIVCPPGLQTYYPSANANITVGAQGKIVGGQALVSRRSTNNRFGWIDVSIVNEGLIEGTSGTAIRDAGSLLSIGNRVGAIIRGVGNAIDTDGALSLTNAGTISGSIVSRQTGNGSNSSFIRNTGLIESGSGTAIRNGSIFLVINNEAGATIRGNGSAIDTNGALYLTNAGTIAGSVVSRTTATSSASTIDTLAGTILGDLTLGAGNDTLAGRYVAGQIITGITGAIDGGAGIDTLALRLSENADLTTFPLLTGFERLSLRLENTPTVTIGAAGSVIRNQLGVSGNGSVTINGTLSGTGQVLTAEYSDGAPTIVNAGTIEGTAASNGYLVRINSANRFQNDGAINAAGNGLSISSQGTFANNGTLQASGTALELWNTSFTNTGTIRSTAGIGAIMSGSSGSNWNNSGTIEGAIAGVQLTSNLINTGLITAPVLAVDLGYYGILTNGTGGRIVGDIRPQTSGVNLFNATVANAGTIDGNVSFGGRGTDSSYGGNRYFALPGGVLNGNLTLGRNETLVTYPGDAGSSGFAGINGTVTATNALLRYRVTADATTAATARPGFAEIGYDLYDDAKLTLTSADTPLVFAGKGSVDITGDISATTRSAIAVADILTASGETRPDQVGLAITNRGTLTLDRSGSSDGFGLAAVQVGSQYNFTNAGTIIVRGGSAPQTTIGISAYGQGSVVNDGLISLDGATGISDAGTVTNRGTIRQIAGGRASNGIYSWNSLNLTNSGTIDVAGTAVDGGWSMTIDNSGRIASTDSIAIGSGRYFSPASITNRAGGTIAGNGTAIQTSGGTLVNAGTIVGTVDLGYGSYYSDNRSYNSATYDGAGGTITGDLRFGNGDDTLIVYDDVTGVSGTIDAGGGTNTYIHARATNGTVTLGRDLPTGFGVEGVRAVGVDTQVTIAAAGTVANDLNLSGTGNIVNTATIDGMVTTDTYRWENGWMVAVPPLASITNQGRMNGGFDGSVGRFVNAATGIVTTGRPDRSAVRISQTSMIDFANAGTIDIGTGNLAVSLTSNSAVTAANDGSITGKLSMSAQNFTSMVADAPLTASLVNRGTMTSAGNAIEMTALDMTDGASSITLDNRGTIETTGKGTASAYLEARGFYWSSSLTSGTRQITVTNSGTIRANAGGEDVTYSYSNYNPSTGQVEEQTYSYTSIATALTMLTNPGQSITLNNSATATIEATGALSTAVATLGALDIINAGTIRGGTSFTANGETYAGAIQSFDAADRIVNTGTIIGSIDTGAGDDRIENYGTLDDDIFLGAGDDTFLHRVSAILSGTVDGGTGTDSLIIDAAGGGTVRGDQFVNFERFSQTGSGAVSYVGAFQATTLDVSGGTLNVSAGETLSSIGPVTITGSDAGETVDNAGTIAGSVALDAGDDIFVDRMGSSVAGGVDGGAGGDLYRVVLSGNRNGIGTRSGFEQLAVTGNGTLTLTLDQSFDSVALTGTGLALALNGNSVGTVTGSDAAEMLSVDGDIGRVTLGGGNDMLVLGTAVANGTYTGGAGSDTLRFSGNAPVTLTGSASGFETIALTGTALNIGGTLGVAGDLMTLGDGAQTVALANGGTINGTLDLGAGNDSFSLAPGAKLNGIVAGGAEDDIATVALAGPRTLDAATLTGFETLASTGTGTLTLTGAQSYGQVVAATDLTVASGASLTAGTVRFAGGNERLTIAGGFAGAVDGGAGSDTIAVSGGSANAPVAFTNVSNVETFGMTGGYATVSGNAALGNAALTGGRLVGLANSTIAASRIDVGTGATFGSAGTVNGNVNVAGTLSPGASPGVMTVNGNVALASGSLSVFELTPTVSDKLVVNGALSIASGATLQIVPVGTLRAGTSYDLITASGGISGGFTTINKPSNLFGVIVQRSDRIQLLGQFLTDSRFSPQVARSIAYANATLAVQPATSTLFDSLPALVDTSGASNARGFAELTPEAYASATQLGVDHALSLTQVARGNAFATDRQDAGAFTFAQTIGQWHTLQGDAAQGSNTARAQSYGFLGGVGYGDRSWMIGAFAGYLNGRQQIGALGARTRADGVVAGVHGRYGADSGWGFSASLLYDGGTADTVRALPTGRDGIGSYALHSWASDVAASYGIDVGDGWSLRPRVGVTYIRTSREAVRETGSSPFALTVAGNRHVSGFADTGVTLARSDASDAPFRPFVSLGARYQLEGQRATALAGYAGNGPGLVAVGAGRTELVGTAAGGVAYRLPSGLDIFASASAQTGRDDHQETISTGVRLRF